MISSTEEYRGLTYSSCLATQQICVSILSFILHYGMTKRCTCLTHIPVFLWKEDI